MQTLTSICTLTLFFSHVWAIHTDVPIHFKKIGKMATALSYGHLHTLVNLTRLATLQTEVDHSIQYMMTYLEFVQMKNTSVYQAYQESGKNIKGLLETMDMVVDNINETFYPRARREKRQILAGLAGIGSILSIGVSIYNTYQIHSLTSQVSGLEENIDSMVQVMGQQDEAINKLEENIRVLNTTTRELLQWMKGTSHVYYAQYTFDKIISLLIRHMMFLQQLREGLNELIHGRLSPNLVTGTNLYKE